MNEECKGCFLYNCCIIRKSEEELETLQVTHCPCRNCLVKVTCGQGDACDLYVNWLELIRNVRELMESKRDDKSRGM